jgi:hypothetical protein
VIVNDTMHHGQQHPMVHEWFSFWILRNNPSTSIESIVSENNESSNFDFGRHRRRFG